MKKAVIYIRVSDPGQIENNSLALQDQACRKFAKDKGYEVIEPIFREEGRSAKYIDTRPELKKLLSFVCTKKNNVSALVVYKFDRFSRNLEDAVATMSLLSKYGVELQSVSEDVDDGPMGKALRNIMITLGELDNDLKGVRVKENMQQAFRKGLWVFKCPIGYKRKFKTKEENRGLPPVQDPNLAPIIERMFKKASTGIYNKAQLARMMNLEGFSDFYRSEANHKTVHKILEKTFYYGNMYAKKWDEYSWGKHEPLIDQETWETAYNKVILKKKRFKYHDVARYPLKGTIHCEECGQVMSTCPSRGTNKIYYYYECKNKKCRKTRINSDQAHKQFVEILQFVKPEELVLDVFHKLVFTDWDKIVNQTREALEKVEQRLAYYKDELKNVRQAKDDGIYTKDEAKEEAEKVRQEILILKLEKSEIKFIQYDAEVVKNFSIHFMNNLDRLWERYSLPKQQLLQQKIFPNGITCALDGKIRTNGLSPSFELIKTLNEQKGENVTPREFESRSSP